MAYCRFGPDSDVYLYASIYGGVDCCGVHEGEGSFRTNSVDEMIEHLHQHEAKGDKVPPRVIPRLKEEKEWIESQPYLTPEEVKKL